jgi:taurine dioxygenase
MPGAAMMPADQIAFGWSRSTAFGAEIGGVDLAAPLAEPTLVDIRHAFGEYGVILFRDQHLTPEQHLVFAREP